MKKPDEEPKNDGWPHCGHATASDCAMAQFDIDSCRVSDATTKRPSNEEPGT